MTREDFKINFSRAVAEDDTELFEEIKPDLYLPYTVLSNKGLDTLTNIAEVAAELLFEEIERLSLEVVKLREDNLSAIAREVIQWGKVKDLDEKNEDLENRLFVKTQKAKNDEFIIQTASDRIELLQKALEDKTTYIEALEHDVKFYHGEVDGLRGDNETLKTLSQKFARELYDMRRERLELKREIKQKDSEIKTLNGLNHTLKIKCNDLIDDLEGCKKELRRRWERIEDQAKRIKELETTIAHDENVRLEEGEWE